MRTSQMLKLEELEQKKLIEVFRDVLINRKRLTVQLPDGEEIIIQPKSSLKPLPILKGYIPQEWKDTIYDHTIE